MATMTVDCLQAGNLAVDQAEEKVERVKAGLTFSQGMVQLVQAMFSFIHLTGAFHEAVQVQGHLIDLLLHPRSQDLPLASYTLIADKLDKLVDMDAFIVEHASSVRYRPWKGYLTTIADQGERLASIAESFRMATDAEVTNNIVQLAANAAKEAEGAAESDWRDFVASLHD